MQIYWVDQLTYLFIKNIFEGQAGLQGCENLIIVLKLKTHPEGLIWLTLDINYCS